jgi:hypothetical protein
MSQCWETAISPKLAKPKPNLTKSPADVSFSLKSSPFLSFQFSSPSLVYMDGAERLALL